MQRRNLIKLLVGLPVIGRLSESLGGNPATRARSRQKPLTACIETWPGEITQILGRPCNGKTTVALSMALEHIEAGNGPVWYFSSTRNSQKIAEEHQLQLTTLPRKTFGKDLAIEERPDWSTYHSERAFAASLPGSNTPLPLTFIDSWQPNTLQLQPRKGFTPQDPAPTLVIYDMDDINKLALTSNQEHELASGFLARKLEAQQLGNTRIVITISLPSVSPFDGIDARPQLSDFNPRRRGNTALVDEIYIIYRPGLYEIEHHLPVRQDDDAEYCDTFIPDYLEIARCNRLTLDRKSYAYIRDKDSGRLRDLTARESQLLIRNFA
jgi:hypothetical protein